MENSYRTTSVFSEEAKKLKQFLLELEGGHETQTVLKDVENFLFDPDNRWRLKQDDISRREFTQAVFFWEILKAGAFCTIASK